MSRERTLRIDVLLRDGLDDDQVFGASDEMFDRIEALLKMIPEIESIEGASWGPTNDQ